ncbi:MAG: uroporphyrinogen-III C-methyltransferase [Pontibacterium sp.]
MSKKENKQQKNTQPDTDIIEGELVEATTDAETTNTASSAAVTEPEAKADQPAPEATPDKAPDTAPETEKEPQKAGATWPGKVALILSLAALGTSGYLYWLSLQQQQSQSELRTTLSDEVKNNLSRSSGETSRSLANMNQQIEGIRSQASADKINIEELQLRLTHSMQQVSAQQQSNRKDWLLAETEYLLRLANQRVLMEKTADGALKLLKSADKILQETDDVTIYEVRKALATDIAALEAVPTVDTQGLFLKLGALNAQVKNLRQVPISEQREIPELLKELTPETVSEGWATGMQASWNNAMNKLNSLIVIQQRDETIAPLLSPKENFYLQQNLRLMLEQAQLALLQREQGAYTSSLTKAATWIAEYFDPKDATSQSLLRGISELKTVQVSPEVPDISGSLSTLKAYLSKMTQLKEKGAA